MRRLGCMSADVYCQITNNLYLRNNIILYSNGKKGERASFRRDRELLKMEMASILKMAFGRGINYFGISREPNVRITFSWETILMGKGDQQRYIKITKIKIIFADVWWHLVTTTFHLHFPKCQCIFGSWLMLCLASITFFIKKKVGKRLYDIKPFDTKWIPCCSAFFYSIFLKPWLTISWLGKACTIKLFTDAISTAV
jgi:hypothetical protein